jgi:hypothetical protein
MITSVTIFAEIVNLRNVLMTFSQALVFFFALLNPFLFHGFEGFPRCDGFYPRGFALLDAKKSTPPPY